MLISDLKALDCEKEGQQYRRNLHKRHGVEAVLGKRSAPEFQEHFEPMGKRAKLGERFTADFFTLD